MATKRGKDGRIEEDREPKTATVSEDRISELPDDIILNILSFLPTLVAVRMSLLSKRWRHMWSLVPALDFCYSRDVDNFRTRDEENTEAKKLYKFLDECLKRPYADATITKFKLDMEFFGSSARVDGWLWFPVNKNVKELEIRIGNITSILYSLPRSILHLRSLTLLRLSGVVLGRLSTASLPSLKALNFDDVDMDDQTLDNILLGSPSLEELSMTFCTGLLDPQVSSSSLKSLVFHIGGSRCRIRTIKVEATNLWSFKHISSCYIGPFQCSISPVRCRELRKLSLHDAPNLPLLETLKLDDCYCPRSIKIRNQHLKNFSLTLNYPFDSLEVAIDTPSLAHFQYTGRSMFKISVNAPNLLVAGIKVSDYGRKAYNKEWYANLMKFLSEFNGCKNVHMFCWSTKVFIISLCTLTLFLALQVYQ